MRIITCASYYGSGSSAVTDLISESSEVFSLGEYEYRFLQDPNGISDLEYNIVDNNHRHNTSNAIKEYLKYVKSLHSFGYANTYKIFGEEFDRATKEFIDSIVQLQTKTWWHKDRIDKGKIFCLVDRVYSLLNRIMKGQLHSESKYSILQHTEVGYFTAISRDEFLNSVRRYIDRIFNYVNKEKKSFVMVDQMVPPTNTNRYVRYFNDVKIIVVDRDPRDIYLSEKKIWRWGVIPYKDVREFCEWYKITRYYSNDEEDSELVLRIRFEDLIYAYEATRKKILDFVGLDNAFIQNKGCVFNPNKSIKNTNLKIKFPEEKENIKYIEKELKEYLYDFK